MIPDEFAEEAERLAKLPRADQLEVLRLHRSVADNPEVPEADREAARLRADTLERHLNRIRRKRKKS